MSTTRSIVAAAGLVALGCGVLRAQDWPCFTGPNHDNTQPGAKGLASTWPASGPTVVWQVNAAGGGSRHFASPIVAGGKVFVMGRDYKLDKARQKIVESTPDFLLCLDAEDGRELWRQEFQPQAPYTGDVNLHWSCWHTPVVDGDKVYARGPNGELRAITVKDGKTAWTWPQDPGTLAKSPLSDYEISAPCIVVDDILIFPVYSGLTGRLRGLDKNTGEQKWEMPDFGCWQHSAGCMIPMELGGKKVVVVSNFVFDPKTGRNLMPIAMDRGSGWGVRATLPAGIEWVATCAGDKLISGYCVGPVEGGKQGAGVMCMQLSLNKNGTVASKVLWKTAWKDNNEEWVKAYGGPVVQGNNLYVCTGWGTLSAILCVSMADGKVLWTEEKPKPEQFYVNVIGADGKIFYHLDGRLHMFAADPTGYKELAAANVSWSNWCTPALVGTRMFLRDDTGTVKCLELKAP